MCRCGGLPQFRPSADHSICVIALYICIPDVSAALQMLEHAVPYVSQSYTHAIPYASKAYTYAVPYVSRYVSQSVRLSVCSSLFERLLLYFLFRWTGVLWWSVLQEETIAGFVTEEEDCLLEAVRPCTPDCSVSSFLSWRRISGQCVLN